MVSGVRLTSLLAAAIGLTAAAVGLGVALTDGGTRKADVPNDPLADISLAGLVPHRALYCDRIPESAIADAVGPSATASAWSPGQAAELEPGLSDVPHEYGCAYSAETTVARAWVFGSPVSAAQAQSYVDEAKADTTCSPAGEISFGTPGAVLICTSTDGRTLLALGRIDESWVRCELTLAPDDPAPDLDARGQRWCVAAAYAMAAS